MIEYEKKIIEHWRKLYPHLSDEDLLKVDEAMRGYLELVMEIGLHDLKKEPPEED